MATRTPSMDYRESTEEERDKMQKSRDMMVEAIQQEKSLINRMMPTMGKAARDDMRAAKALRESVPYRAREYEAYNDAGYKKGGKVKKMAVGGSASSRADGCAMKGKTKGTMVKMKSGGKC
jgi:hypothetical protein